MTVSRPAPARTRNRGVLLALGTAAVVWIAAYLVNERLWDQIVFGILGLDEHSRLGVAVHFFLYDTSKILLLITGLIFAIGMARAAIPPERIRDLVSGRHVAIGFLLAATFGALTPFCSCSSVPLFIGFVAAGVPLGITLTFLIASPLINEVGVVMLAGMVGWEVAALYVATGMALAILAGVALSHMHLDRFIEPFVRDVVVPPTAPDGAKPTLRDRVDAARQETREIVRSVLPYVLIGIAIGAAIHGWLPAAYFADTGIADSLWAVPAATMLGVPLYANVAGVVPLVDALYAKGLGLGTTMAFMMSVVALSLPSLVLLKRVMRLPLLAIFTAVVTVGIMAIGYLFDVIA
jgi:uncharacterized protein